MLQGRPSTHITPFTVHSSRGATGEALVIYMNKILYMNKIRMSVCPSVCLSVYLSVRPLSTFRELDKGAHIIYGWKRNLSSSVAIYISNLSDQLSGRYCPETGHDWKKPAKISLF